MHQNLHYSTIFNMIFFQTYRNSWDIFLKQYYNIPHIENIAPVVYVFNKEFLQESDYCNLEIILRVL